MDEKTGIQAIERFSQPAPESKGGYKRIEYEYIRHGTTTLIAANNVENGQWINYHLGPTRDEADLLATHQQNRRWITRNGSDCDSG
ncbi:MAG: hypothetical protein R3B93_18390 [Bacteroidia bacterium]